MGLLERDPAPTQVLPDGRDEIALARYATVNERFAVYDDALPGGGLPAFDLLWAGGDGWPGTDYATSIAFGHVDGTPGAELGVGRFAAEGLRTFILSRGWMGWLPFIQSGLVTEDFPDR